MYCFLIFNSLLGLEPVNQSKVCFFPLVPTLQVEVLVSEVEPMPEREPEPRSEPIEEIPSPPTEPQVAPIDSLTDV